MIKQLEKLTEEERELLLKAPVLVSVLASCSFNKVNEVQKADAIKLAHLKTFTAVPVLQAYYQEVDKNFREQFEATAKKYFPFDEKNRQQIEKEIQKISLIIEKLEAGYGNALRKSLDGYARHVKKSTHSVFQDFLFPMPIPGLSD